MVRSMMDLQHIFHVGNTGRAGALRPLEAASEAPGAVWPKAQRKLWLQLFEGSFDLIHLDKEGAAD
jgi:hypothetical protein